MYYQTYSRSFDDIDGDGINDLPGHHGKIDYRDDFGVNFMRDLVSNLSSRRSSDSKALLWNPYQEAYTFTFPSRA